MKLFTGIALFIFWTSSFIQKGPKIEIYLAKYRVPPMKNENWPSTVVHHFHATQSEIQDSPFIMDKEIISYDSTMNNIHLSKSAALKISNLNPLIPEGIQFILTIDKVPTINGYFINKNASEPVVSYMIMNKNDTLCHIDRLLPGIRNDARKDSNLISAFKTTNRLQ